MKTSSVKQHVIIGMMIALTFLVTRFAGFTAPFGYFNLGDSIIMTAGILLGKKVGFAAGAFGASLSDVFTPGFLLFAPITFVVKGLEGYVVGAIMHQKGHNNKLQKVFAVIAGSCIMIAGYFLGETFVLGAIDKAYGISYAINEMVGTNIIQGILNSIISYILSALLLKTNLRKYISDS